LNIGIIGAGYAGLAAAYELQKAGHRTTVLEAAPYPGGLASGFKAPHWEWPLEKFYHHLFTNDDAILNLAREIGVGHTLRTYRPSTVMVHDGVPYPFDGPLQVLRYPGLSFIEKIRTGLPALYLKLQSNWRPFEQVTAHEWLRRWMGEGAYRKIWEPLLIGKFGEANYREVPMSWFWARIYKRTPSLIYFDGGFQGFAEALVRAVETRGGQVRLGTPVKALRQTAGGWEIETAAGYEQFDRVLSTVSPDLMLKLAPQLPADYLAALQQLKSLGAVVLTLALDRKLTRDCYWINLDKRIYPMLALVEHTNMVDPRHYGGDHLLYLGDYLPADHPYLGYDAEQLFDVYEPALKAFNPAFERSWVRNKWKFSASYAQPVPPLRYSERIPAIKTPLPGLFFASMSHVYPWDRGTNYAIEIGQRAVQEILREPQREFA
jgi:protoporphyrinogen oxidase